MSSKPKKTSRTSKVRPVPVAEMRVPPVLVTQRKFNRAQAEEYAAHFDPDKLGIPIVNFRNGVYWILDGQHRIAALKLWFHGTDPGVIDAEVYEGLTDAQAADIFLGRDDRRAISTFEKFHVACTAEHGRECDIRRIVEANGLKVSQAKDPNCVGAVSAIGAVYDAAGSTVLGQTIRTLRDAYGGDPQAFDAYLIRGVGMVFNRFNGKTHEKHLIQQLAQLPRGARGVIQRAETQRERTGAAKVQCVAATICDIYNKGVRHTGQRLPSWWKEADECATTAAS
jgi:hypothetical protein